MSLDLLEIVRAVQLGKATISAETAGYLVLETAEQLARLRRRISPRDLLLHDTGELQMNGGVDDTPDSIETSLRELLARLLDLCHVSHASLVEVSKRRRAAPALVLEIEAALIPLNRAASRRALARVYRETERALKSGLLMDLSAACELLEPPSNLRPATSSGRVESSAASIERGTAPVVRPNALICETGSGHAAPRRGDLTAAPEIEEQTVRIDQIRLNLQVALRQSQQTTERAAAPSDPIRAALAAVPADKTPFLGSIITAADEPPPASEETSIVAQDTEPFLTEQQEPESDDAAESDRGWGADLIRDYPRSLEVLSTGAEEAASLACGGDEIAPPPPDDSEVEASGAVFSFELGESCDELILEAASRPSHPSELRAESPTAVEEAPPGGSEQQLVEEAPSGDIEQPFAERVVPLPLEALEPAPLAAAPESSEHPTSEPLEPVPPEAAEPESAHRFYTPRKSDLSELLQSFVENSERNTGDVARKLKQLAGVPATSPRRGAPKREQLKTRFRRSRSARDTRLSKVQS